MKTKQTKTSIIDSIYKSDSGYQLKMIKGVVEDFLVTLSSSLKDGNSVELRGLGTFEIVPVKGKKNARNPKTGEAVTVKSHCKVRFKPAKDLRDSVKKLDTGKFKK